MIDQSIAEQLVTKGQRMEVVCEDYKSPRIKDIQKSEEVYLKSKKPTLPGQLNIPMDKVFLAGFVDTLLAKTDDKPTINFFHKKLSDLKRAKKVTASWEAESGEDKADWASHDRDAKKFAAFSGVGTFKIWSEQPYKHHLGTVDYLDWIFEPMGGKYIEDHLFQGETNIFKSKFDLIEGAKSGLYDFKQVAKLVSAFNTGENKKVSDQYQDKLKRFKDMGLDPESHSYIGETVYNLTEMVLVHKGIRYYILFQKDTGIWVRAEKWSVLDESGLYPYAFFQTNEDRKNVLSKAPVDDVLPIAEMIRILWNETINNLRKRNWQMQAYDSEIFPDPSQLEWRPNGLVAVNGLKEQGRSVQSGIYQFQTPDTTGITINLMDYIDQFLGQKSGIGAGVQGANDEDAKVGIYYGNLQQVADRLGLYNKSYSRAWTQLGTRYYHNLKNNITEDIFVNIIGEKGVEEEVLTSDDLKPDQDFGISVAGGNAQVQLDEVKKRQRQEALNDIINSPSLAARINPDMTIEYRLREGGYNEDEIKAFLDVDNYANQELLSEASQAITDIVNGKKPPINRGANIAFIEYIADYIANTNSLKPNQIAALQAYNQAHIDSGIVQENVTRQMKEQVLEQGAANFKNEQTPDVVEPNVPIPDTPAGTAAKSAENVFKPVV